MSLYNHCRYRNSWDCGDGWCSCENCKYFVVDLDTLSDEQREAIKLMILLEDMKGGE